MRNSSGSSQTSFPNLFNTHVHPGAPRRIRWPQHASPIDFRSRKSLKYSRFLICSLCSTNRFRWFLEEGLKQIFDQISPIEDFSGSLALELTDHRFGDPLMSVDESKERDSNYSCPLFVTARFVNRGTGEIKEQQVFLGDFPMMTDNGTFIINGTERVVVSQLVRSRASTTTRRSTRLLTRTSSRPRSYPVAVHGSSSTRTSGTRLVCGLTAKRRQYVSAFLRALDIADTDEEILALFDGAESIKNTLKRDTAVGKDEALLDLYRKLRPGEPTTVESARGLIQTLFKNPKRYDLTRVGRYKLNQKFENPIDHATDDGLLTEDDIIDAIRYLVHLHANQTTMKTALGNDIAVRTDDIDHFGNRRVRTVGELIQNQIRVGLTRLERVVKERMTTQDPESITPQSLIKHPSGRCLDQGVLRDESA